MRQVLPGETRVLGSDIAASLNDNLPLPCAEPWV
jgi:hypothetical protein